MLRVMRALPLLLLLTATLSGCASPPTDTPFSHESPISADEAATTPIPKPITSNSATTSSSIAPHTHPKISVDTTKDPIITLRLLADDVEWRILTGYDLLPSFIKNDNQRLCTYYRDYDTGHDKTAPNVDLALQPQWINPPNPDFEGCVTFPKSIDHANKFTGQTLTHTFLSTGSWSVEATYQMHGEAHSSTTQFTIKNTTPRPHVVIGVSDTNINPYHEVYSRPYLRDHPCTYLQNYSCDTPSLNLTINPNRPYNELLQEDKAIWDNLDHDATYWVPGTNIIHLRCENHRFNAELPVPGAPRTDYCILNDDGEHGTQTTGVAILASPDALLAFHEGQGAYEFNPYPYVDVTSNSLGTEGNAPAFDWEDQRPIMVQAIGNYGTPQTCSCANSVHYYTIGGAHTRNTEYAYKIPENSYTMTLEEVRDHGGTTGVSDMWNDFTQNHCQVMPTTQQPNSDYWPKGWLRYYHKSCGTSFSAPRAAGSLAQALLEERRESKYTGHSTQISKFNWLLDPHTGLTSNALRDAMNATATQQPTSDATFTNTWRKELEDAGFQGFPQAQPSALDWGYGWISPTTARHAIQVALGNEPAPAIPIETQLIMKAIWQIRESEEDYVQNGQDYDNRSSDTIYCVIDLYLASTFTPTAIQACATKILPDG